MAAGADRSVEWKTMPPQLLALTEGPNILLDKPILLLGRHQECDIQLGSRKVSRRHCCVAQVNDYLVVRDLGSTNGIRINGVRVVEGSLRSGDELMIGNQRYQVQWHAKANAPVPSQTGAPPAQEKPPAPPPPAAPPPAAPPRSLGEDARLESCEEPIALAEPAPLAQPLPPAFRAAPPPVALPAVGADLLLPDDIHLAPLSDERRADPFPPTEGTRTGS
jgi:predicted component of type VI protein secretion system